MEKDFQEELEEIMEVVGPEDMVAEDYEEYYYE